jgi:hypothetical protein
VLLRWEQNPCTRLPLCVISGICLYSACAKPARPMCAAIAPILPRKYRRMDGDQVSESGPMGGYRLSAIELGQMGL